MLLRDRNLERWQRPLGHLIENFTAMNVTSTWTKGLLSCLLEMLSCIQDSAVKLRTRDEEFSIFEARPQYCVDTQVEGFRYQALAVTGAIALSYGLFRISRS
jgi:hypothetical protein